MNTGKTPQLQSMLLQLKDIHLPEPPGVWPLAPGWYVLIALGTCVILWSLWWGIRRSRRWRIKRVARKRLQAILVEHQQSANAACAFSDLSVLLRRVALVFEGRKVAGLTGDAWLEFLDHSGQTQAFTQGVGRLLISEPYQKAPDPKAIDELVQLVEKWIRRLG